MTDLIQWLLDAGKRVVGFPIREYWLDIGQHADYGQAQDDVRERETRGMNWNGKRSWSPAPAASSAAT